MKWRATIEAEMRRNFGLQRFFAQKQKVFTWKDKEKASNSQRYCRGMRAIAQHIHAPIFVSWLSFVENQCNVILQVQQCMALDFLSLLNTIFLLHHCLPLTSYRWLFLALHTMPPHFFHVWLNKQIQNEKWEEEENSSAKSTIMLGVRSVVFSIGFG